MGHYTSADSRQNTQLPWHCSVIFVQHLYSLHPLAIQSTDEFTSVRACEHCLCMLVFMSRKELMSACLSLNPHDCFIFHLSSSSSLSGFVSNYSTLFVAPGSV